MRYFTRSNPKTLKGEALGWTTLALHLAPSTRAGIGDTCPYASPACRRACLNTSGRGRFEQIQRARVARTKRLFPNGVENPADPTSMVQIAREIDREREKAINLAVRLNTTSDLPFETYVFPTGSPRFPNMFPVRERATLMAVFPDVQFYDYTKNPDRMRAFLTDPNWPPNYHLTFSASETNLQAQGETLANGGSVARIASPEFVQRYRDALAGEGIPDTTVDGDDHDLTFLHPPGSILWLKPKGRAKSDRRGFVMRAD